MGSFLETAVALSQLYRERFLVPNVQMCGQVEENPLDSLKFFLLGYAFERQGRSPDYSTAAFDAIDEVERETRVDRQLAGLVWQRFSERLRGSSLNCANNPLCPKGFKYQRRYKGTIRSSVVGKRSAVELVADEMGGGCIVTWAREQISAGRIAEAHGRICRVNGIHNKIASFFLRDIATHFAIRPDTDRWLLQPVDTWVRLVARRTKGDQELDDPGCAQFLAGATVEPERANQGIWYFCSQVAWSSEYWVERCLAEPQWLQRRVNDHLSRLAHIGDVATGFHVGLEC